MGFLLFLTARDLEPIMRFNIITGSEHSAFSESPVEWPGSQIQCFSTLLS